MKLEIFLSEHAPGDTSSKKGSFWEMTFPETIEVSDDSEQVVRNAIQKVFSLSAPDKNRVSRGVYFKVRFQEKDIFRGHINSGGQIDSIVKI